MENPPETYPDDSIDIADLIRRLRRGLPKTLGLALIGVALGIIIGLITTRTQIPVSSLRVTFGFPGSEHGRYPNGAQFQPEDVRAPDIVNEALKRIGVPDPAGDLATRIRGALSINGLVSANIIKERDRLRAAGQAVPAFFPDEFELALSLPSSAGLDKQQRQALLTEIVSAYQEKFRRNYVTLPQQFDNPFESLKNADYSEYEIILTRQMQALSAYLDQQIAQAKEFRSPTNNLSFQDLQKQVDLFTQIKLNDVLGLIYLGGLSNDRIHAMAKMDYDLHLLDDQEQRLMEEQSVVTDLLAKTQDRAPNYVIAAKTEISQGTKPVLDQGLIDSLLANDAYNFLVRKALDAGLAVKRVQSDKAALQERLKRMESFTKNNVQDQSADLASTREALTHLESSYQDLLKNVRTCLEDYARQEYANAIRISMPAHTQSWLKALLLGAIIGGFTGTALGLGLSLLDLSSSKVRP